MKTRGTLLLLLVSGVWSTIGVSAGAGAYAQTGATPIEVASRGPRFLGRASQADHRGTEQWVDMSGAAVFQRHLSLTLRNVPREQALQEIAQRSGLRLTYSAAVVRLQAPVTLVAEDITVGAALGAVLYDAGVDVLLTENARAALVSRSALRLLRQGGTIVGRVTDTAGRDVTNAEVFLDGSRWRTTTDTAGRYRLAEVDTGTYTLSARRLGYAKRSRRVTVRAGQEDTVNLTLAPVAARLDELVTTATGRRRRIDVPNDITTINADSVMQAAPIHSVTDLLEHRVPGLIVQHTSGAPGDPARLRLRGTSSPLRNNDPIVVVDGVRVYAQQSAERSGNLATNIGGDTSTTNKLFNVNQYAAPSPLDYIDPSSIETIEVVKGPSATTLYGQDAANGVIVITTKKGQAGPTRWTMSAEHGRKQMAGSYPNLVLARGHRVDDQAPVFCPLLATVQDADPCVIDSLSSFQLLNDPALTVLDKGNNNMLTLGVSGGVRSLTYILSGQYQDQLGLVKLPDYEVDRYKTLEGGGNPPDWMRRPQRLGQWGVTAAVTANMGANASVSLTSSLSRTKQQRSNLENRLPDLMSVFLDRSTGLYYPSQGDVVGSPINSLIIGAYRERVTDAALAFTNGLTANWRARPWLALNANVGLNVQQRADEMFIPRARDTLMVAGSGPNASGFSVGYLNFASGVSIMSTANAGAIATAPLGHGLQLRFASGINYAGTSINDGSTSTDHVPYGTSEVGTRTGQQAYRHTQDDATFGWYVAPSITHPRFAIDLGLRLDGGSSYGGGVSGFKLPAFPKLGGSYLLSDESWFPLKSVFQSFRVRASYGRAGRQPGPTDRLRLYGTIYPALGNNGVTDITELATLGNTELRPERSGEFEGGFDADLLDSRLNVTLSGYRRTTNDALVPFTLPPSVYGNGVTVLRNIGVTRNTGLELTVDAQLVRSTMATWSTQLILTQGRSKVVRLAPGLTSLTTDINSIPGSGTVLSSSRIVPGYPVDSRWATPILGYADANGDGVLEPSEVLMGDTAVFVGQQEPDYTATLMPQVSLWHGALTVAASISHEGGLSQTNGTLSLLQAFSHGTNDPNASLGEQLATGGAVSSSVEARGFLSTQIVTTTRFDNLSVSYNLPAHVARHLGAEHLSISVQGSNLGLRTNYRGMDPNVNAYATGNSVTDTGVLPMPRAWLVKVNAAY